MQHKESTLAFLQWLFSDPGKLAIAGALGGLVRWITLRDNWRDGALGIIVGVICATYLSPLAIPILEPVVGKIMPAGDVDGFSAFIIGMGGIAVSGFLIGVWEDWRRFVRRKK